MVHGARWLACTVAYTEQNRKIVVRVCMHHLIYNIWLATTDTQYKTNEYITLHMYGDIEKKEEEGKKMVSSVL